MPAGDMMSETLIADAAATLAAQLQCMMRLRIAAWVFDIDHSHVLWANPEALKIWNAQSLEELTSRDMGSYMSVSVSKRLQQYQTDFTESPAAEFNEIWTIYPDGEPRTIDVNFTGFQLHDNRMAMFCEASQQQAINVQGLRSAEALLHTPL